MFYKLSLDGIPVIGDIYKIERKTVWRHADVYNILVMICEGECLFQIGGAEYAVRRGDMVFIPAGQEYVRRPSGEETCVFCYIHFALPRPVETLDSGGLYEELQKLNTRLDSGLRSENFAPAELRPDLFLTGIITQSGDDREERISEIFSYLDRALTEVYKYDAESRLMISLSLCQILAAASRGVVRAYLSEYKVPDDDMPEHLKKATVYIRQNYKKKLNIGQICEHCNISPQHLIRLFKANLGVTPIQYVNNVKIYHSKELMRMTTLTVKEISYELGFTNPHYFSRLFYKIEGRYPEELKARYREVKLSDAAK